MAAFCAGGTTAIVWDGVGMDVGVATAAVPAAAGMAMGVTTGAADGGVFARTSDGVPVGRGDGGCTVAWVTLVGAMPAGDDRLTALVGAAVGMTAGAGTDGGIATDAAIDEPIAGAVLSGDTTVRAGIGAIWLGAAGGTIVSAGVVLDWARPA